MIEWLAKKYDTGATNGWVLFMFAMMWMSGGAMGIALAGIFRLCK